MAAIYLANPGEFRKFTLSVMHAVDSEQPLLPPDLLSPVADIKFDIPGADVVLLTLESIDHYDPNITYFMNTAGLETVICIPLPLTDPFRRSTFGLLGIALGFSPRKHNEFALAAEQADRLKALATLISLALSRSAAVEKLTRAEAMVERQQRFISQAEIAAGVAHDASNILNTLSASYLLLEREIDRSLERRSNARLQETLESVEQSLHKLSTYFQSLRSYARLTEPSQESCDINSILHNCIELLDHRMRKRRIKVECRLGDIPTIKGDKNHLFQALFNIMINALDAMRERGTLSIATRRTDRRISIRISDDGIGIERADLPRIFEPFFTTKEHGTGVGLTIASKIVEAHGGAIEVMSKRGKGTTFFILLQDNETKRAVPQRGNS